MTATTPAQAISSFRIRFSKVGDARFLSHHDLMRLWERALRRAHVQPKRSGKFNPRPHITFAAPLSLGIVGRDEVVDIDLLGTYDSPTVRSLIESQLTEGIHLLSIEGIAERAPNLIDYARYFFPLPESEYSNLNQQIEELLKQTSVIVRRVAYRKAKMNADPMPEERFDVATSTISSSEEDVRHVDIRVFLANVWRDPKGLWMDLKITPNGAARPEEVLTLLGLNDLMLDGVAILERTQLVMAEIVSAPQPAKPKPEQERSEAKQAGNMTTNSECKFAGF